MDLRSLFSSVQSIEKFIKNTEYTYKNNKMISKLIGIVKDSINYDRLDDYRNFKINILKQYNDFYLIQVGDFERNCVGINLNYKLTAIGLTCYCNKSGICKHKVLAIAYLLSNGFEKAFEFANPLHLVDDGFIEEKIYRIEDLGNWKHFVFTPEFDKHTIINQNNSRRRCRSRWKLAFFIKHTNIYGNYQRIDDEKEKLVISPCMQFIKKDGSFSHISENYILENITEEISPSEQTLLHLISRTQGNSISLKFSLEWLIENEKELTLFYYSNHNYVRLKFCEIKSFSLDFFVSNMKIENNEISHIQFQILLKCILTDQNKYIEITNFDKAMFKYNDFYILSDDGRVLYKKNLSYRLVSILKDYLINKKLIYSEVIAIKNYLKNKLAKEVKVDFVDNTIKTITMVPKPILELKQIKGHLCGINLVFRYKSIECFYKTQNNKSPVVYDPNTSEYTIRNIDFEKGVFDYLNQQLEKYAAPKCSGNNIFCTYAVDIGFNDFILKKGIMLIEEGYEIRVENNRSISKSFGKLSYQINSKIDWFDIEANIQDDAGNLYRISFDESDIKSGLIFYNNNYYILTKDDIQKLQALIQTGVQTDNSIRISKFNFDVIDQIYDDIKNNQEKELKKIKTIIEKLKDFKKINRTRLPRRFKGKLRNYQKSGYYWLHFLHKYDICGCLADDMGLGKTVQALCFLQYLKEKTGKLKILLIVPVTTMSNWEWEIRRFTPDISFIRNYGNNRTKDIEILKEYDIMIISYHTLVRDIEWLKDTNYDYVILDESQYIKNANTKIAKAVRILQSKHRLSLTGTPVENNTLELWSQMNFLNPGLLGPLQDFKSKFTYPIEKYQDKEAAERLRKLIFPFLLRRKKEDVLNDLPDKEEIIQYLEMENKQKIFYDAQKEHYKKLIEEKIDSDGVGNSAIQILDALLRLRQIVLFPQLLKTGYKPKDSCKYNLIIEMLPEIMEEDHKVLLFSQFVGVLDIIRSFFDKSKIQYCYIDGSTKRRDLEIDKFQNDDKIKLFLLSLKAGGIGINLTSADYVVLFDPWWNPAIEKQAIDRAYRIGQAKKVTVYKLIVKDSIEEKILTLQESKKELVNKLITQDAGFFKSLNKDDIIQLFD